MILKRTIEEKLLNLYKDRKPLVLFGMRQTGKTTTINNFLKTHCSDKTIVKLDLSGGDKEIFLENDTYDSIIKTVEINKGVKVDANTVIFIDEVQDAENAYKFIKWTADNPDSNIKLICSGSYITKKVITEKYKVHVGSYNYLTMYPLSFYEFLDNMGKQNLLESVKHSISNEKGIYKPHHDELLRCLNEYLLIGGMPEIVNKYINNMSSMTGLEYALKEMVEQQKIDIARDLKKPDAAKITNLYNSIFTSLNNTKGASLERLKLSILNKVNNAYSRYQFVIDILIRSNVLTAIYQTRGRNNEIYRENLKLIYSDLGYLSTMKTFDKVKNIISSKYNLLSGEDRNYIGAITESFVALELKKYNSKAELQYWYKPKGQIFNKEKNRLMHSASKEMDFIYLGNPIDVKSGTNKKTTPSMKFYRSTHQYDYWIIISKRNFHIDHKNKAIKLPLYAIWLLDDLLKGKTTS